MLTASPHHTRRACLFGHAACHVTISRFCSSLRPEKPHQANSLMKRRIVSRQSRAIMALISLLRECSPDRLSVPIDAIMTDKTAIRIVKRRRIGENADHDDSSFVMLATRCATAPNQKILSMSNASFMQEVARRRTFAIISHPNNPTYL